MDYISLYFDFVKIKLKAIVEYPGAFWAETIAKVMGWAANILIIFLMIFRFESVLNWSSYEVLFLYSINATSYALAGFFMYHSVGRLPEHIQMGTFDEMLTKPVNPFFYLCAKGFSTGYIGNLCSSIPAIIICIIKLDLSMNLLNICHLVVVVIGAALIHSSLFMLTNIPAFWIIKSDALSSFRWVLDDFIRYPISIYDRWIQIMLTFIFPVAFINFYPAQAFLRKGDLLGFSSIFVYLTPAIGIILFALGYMSFFMGIRHYKSTGS